MSLISVEEYNAFPIVPADLRIAYGDNENHFIDLFLPKGEGALTPVLILIHGGCWRDRFGLEKIGQMAEAIAANGIAVCNIEYRRLGNGGGWPNTFLDVANAADKVAELAQEFAFDLTRVVAVGHSAGGHLAMWLAGRHKISTDSQLYSADPLSISTVISLAGIPDMERAVVDDLCSGAPQELLGGLPNVVPARYAAGSPKNLLPLHVPQLHINGTEDWIVPIDYVRDFVDLAKQQGDKAELIAIPDAGHFEIVSAATKAWSVVQKAIVHSCQPK